MSTSRMFTTLRMQLHQVQIAELRLLQEINATCLHATEEVTMGSLIKEKCIEEMKMQCNTVSDDVTCYSCVLCGLHIHLKERK